MIKILSTILSVIVALHGLVHLMGFVAYWPLAKIPELPYKTALLGGRWEVGASGMRLFSLLWLLAALGFLASALALVLGRPAWAPLLLVTALLSLALCVLDWAAAFRGAWIDIALLLVLAVVFGLRVRPVPFPAFTAPAAALETVPLPSGLPAPVERFYRQTYGDRIPVYRSVVMSGRGTVRFMGVTLPARLRFSHISGQGYRHYIEATFYGWPVFKVNERYLDGHGRLELPFGQVVAGDPKVDSAGNQGLWAETLSYPAYLLTDPRLRWEPIDSTHARLVVPFGEAEQVFTVAFDPQSGDLVHFETERYRDAKLGTITWSGDLAYAESQDGEPRTQTLAATWEDEGTPWLIYTLEETVFNADLSGYIRQRGP